MSIRKLAKRYGNVVAFKDVSLDIYKGDRVLLIGPNGNGKSTFLRVIAGVTEPSRGRVNKSRDLSRRRIAYVSQTGGFLPHLTLAQNIAIARQAYRLPLQPDFRSMGFLFDLGLDAVLDRNVGALSVGFQRLTSLAMALATFPSAMVLDEPLASLDRDKSAAALQVLSKVEQSSMFLIASHHGGPLPFEPNRVLVAADNRIADEPPDTARETLTQFMVSSNPQSEPDSCSAQS